MSSKEKDLLVKQKYYSSHLQKLQTIKASLLKIANQNKKNTSFDGDYRSKTIKVYKQKLRKVFHPLKMEEYDHIQNFEQYFEEYIDQTHKIQNLAQNNQPYSNQTIRQMTKKDTFQTILTLSIEQICKLQSLRRQKQQVVRQIQKISLPRKELPKITRNKPYHNDNIKQGPIIFSPIFVQDQSRILNEPMKRNSSSNSALKSLLTRSNSIRFRRQLFISESFYTPSKIVDRVNQLNESRSSQHNLRIILQKFKEGLIKRLGNQIITSYLEMPSILSLNIICQALNSISQSSKKQQLMIAFLSLDLNKDGFICQNDIFQISQRIQIRSLVNKDLYKLADFCKNTYYKIPVDSQLPQQFAKNPERKLYLKFFQKENSSLAQSGLKLPALTDRIQHFTISCPSSSRNSLSYTKQDSKNHDHIKINFRMFQEIFIDQKCQFIEDLLGFLLQQETQRQMPALIRLKRKNTCQYDPKLRSQSLQLKRSTRSIQSIESNIRQTNKKQSKRAYKMSKLRSNTEGTSILELQNNIEDEKNKDLQNKNYKNKILLHEISCSHQSSTSNKAECQICHQKYAEDRKVKFTGREVLPQDLIDKIKVFRKDQRNLTIAHYGMQNRPDYNKNFQPIK